MSAKARRGAPPWIRVYVDLLDDPVLQNLAPGDYKLFLNLTLLAGRSSPRGEIPGSWRGDGVPVTVEGTPRKNCTPPAPFDARPVAYALRISPKRATDGVARLEECGLLERNFRGALMPRRWNDEQPLSDHSTPRVQKHRDKAHQESHETHGLTPDSPEMERFSNDQEPFPQPFPKPFQDRYRTVIDGDRDGDGDETERGDARGESLAVYDDQRSAFARSNTSSLSERRAEAEEPSWDADDLLPGEPRWDEPDPNEPDF